MSLIARSFGLCSIGQIVMDPYDVLAVLAFCGKPSSMCLLWDDPQYSEHEDCTRQGGHHDTDGHESRRYKSQDNRNDKRMSQSTPCP